MGRSPKNHRPDLNGLLVLDKPLRMSSAGACRLVRRISGGAKVGHAGTLDPLATGVLVICLGAATRHIAALMAGEKRYLADVDLSAFSSTDDMEGDATPVPASQPPTPEEVRAALARLTGHILQSPPMFSAVHVGGRRAYHLARKGQLPNRPAPRPVVVHSIDMLDYAFPRLSLDIRCGKGTYIRSIARDLGLALGTGGRLASLQRTAVGPFTIDRAIAPADLPQPLLPEHLLPSDATP